MLNQVTGRHVERGQLQKSVVVWLFPTYICLFSSSLSTKVLMNTPRQEFYAYYWTFSDFAHTYHGINVIRFDCFSLKKKTKKKMYGDFRANRRRSSISAHLSWFFVLNSLSHLFPDFFCVPWHSLILHTSADNAQQLPPRVKCCRCNLPQLGAKNDGYCPRWRI